MKPEIITEEEDTLEKSLSEINRIKKAQAIAKIEQLNKEIDFSLFADVSVYSLKFKYLLMQNEVRKANRGCTRLKAKYERLRDKLERIVTGKEVVNSIAKHLSSRGNNNNGKCDGNGNGNKKIHSDCHEAAHGIYPSVKK